ncbi:nuclear transport factor 2 family protein [Hymenobacter aerilatus]|uniref:Nuclear transport factor 2 family protein n=1 Tax=Hymenobacter aerilatus TaxID=2932251 RepID=A0A8T9SYR8_9BACT|nr:nuclear transport factor 2 family protein [Hymenobacter aerilatus]UOR07005.1 nuclear transport factor 2 family protein [Hymenobacter aerilatus]
MTKNLFGGCTLLLLTACATTRPAAVQAPIRQVLTTQAAAWNRGDIPAFMQGYWRSDSLVFIGKRGPTYGWQQTLDNYRSSYPDATAMGQLAFSDLYITPNGPQAAHVVGRWHLTRPTAGDVGGHFLLVFRQVKGHWVIVADHTNSER